jgi:hypothetical protein
MDVLENIQRSLEQALTQTAETPAVPSPPEPPNPDDASWRAGLQQLDARLEQLQACVRRADEATADADFLLSTSADALAHWLSAVASQRRRLAD